MITVKKIKYEKLNNVFKFNCDYCDQKQATHRVINETNKEIKYSCLTCKKKKEAFR